MPLRAQLRPLALSEQCAVRQRFWHLRSHCPNVGTDCRGGVVMVRLISTSSTNGGVAQVSTARAVFFIVICDLVDSVQRCAVRVMSDASTHTTCVSSSRFSPAHFFSTPTQQPLAPGHGNRGIYVAIRGQHTLRAAAAFVQALTIRRRCVGPR